MKALISPVNYNHSFNISTIRYPITAYLKVTENCMFRCNFCSQGKCNSSNLNLDLAKKVLKELKEMGVKYITYTGGEPLLYRDIIELAKYGHELGFNQILVSNLYNMFVGNNEELLNYINSIGVSFHGRKETYNKIVGRKNAYSILCRNIDKLIKKNITINLNYTISNINNNYDDIKFAVDFAKSRNIRLCFGRLNYIGLSKKTTIIDPNSYLAIVDNFRELYDKIEISNCISTCSLDAKFAEYSHGCGAGISMISINSKGEVTLCPSSQFVIGNVCKHSLKKIWNSKYLNIFKKMDYLSNSCRICKYVSTCKGGCHAEGTGMFYKDNCDSLHIKKQEDVWKIIKNKKIFLKFNHFRKEKNNYLIFGNPSRIINKNGFKIISSIDGKYYAKDIVNKFENIDNSKDFIISLYLDGFIGV